VTVKFGPERELLVRVLQLWTKRRGSVPEERALSNQLQSLHIASPDWGLTRLRVASLPVEIGGRTQGFLVGPPVNEQGISFQPVASVRITASESRLELCIRLATYYLDKRGDLAADGWRFESGETGAGAPHPWAHVQRTTRWYKEEETLLDALPPSAENPPDEPTRTEACPHRVNEFRPAIPIACTTPAGLALTMIGSVHGGPFLQDLIDTDEKLKHSLHAHDGHVLLLRS
jgi:hypothetical protein